MRRVPAVMLGIISLVTILAILLVFLPAAALAIQYTFTSIRPPDEVGGAAEGINDLGQIVGIYDSHSAPGLGYFYDTRTSTTTIYDLFRPGSSDYTRLTGINNSGQMVGEQYNGNTQYAYGLVITGNTYTTFSVPGATFTFANKINNLGQVVGYGESKTGDWSRSFIYSGGNITYIDPPDPSITVYHFRGINDNGQICGELVINHTTNGFLYNGTAYTIFNVPGAIQTIATGINNLGQIVGSYDDSTGHGHGFLRDTDGTFTTIDWPDPNAINTQAYGINNLGQIVGSYQDTGTHAFLATPVSQPPKAICQNVTANAGSTCTATASIDNGSYAPNGDPVTLTQAPAGPYQLGTTPVTLTVTDSKNPSNQSQCIGKVTVQDKTPPVITMASVNPSVLWPPNHKMVNVTVNYTSTDNCSSQPICTISGVTSNEPISSSDYSITDAHHVKLSADRLGSGNGRIYTIAITCKDAAGNSSTQTVAVTVPHDQGKN